MSKSQCNGHIKIAYLQERYFLNKMTMESNLTRAYYILIYIFMDIII